MNGLFEHDTLRAGIAVESPQRPEQSERREDLQRIARPDCRQWKILKLKQNGFGRQEGARMKRDVRY